MYDYAKQRGKACLILVNNKQNYALIVQSVNAADSMLKVSVFIWIIVKQCWESAVKIIAKNIHSKKNKN